MRLRYAHSRNRFYAFHSTYALSDYLISHSDVHPCSWQDVRSYLGDAQYRDLRQTAIESHADVYIDTMSDYIYFVR